MIALGYLINRLELVKINSLDENKGSTHAESPEQQKIEKGPDHVAYSRVV